MKSLGRRYPLSIEEMSKMKQSKMITIVFALLAFVVGVSKAQVPVTDVAHITLDETNQVANIAKYVEMIAQYKQQIDQMKQQYDSLTGSRGLGGIMNDPSYADYLPSEWQDVYKRVQDGGYQGLTGSAQAIRDANKVFDSCATKTGVDKQVCERSVVKASQDKAFASGAFDKAKDRWDQIQGLMEQINGTDDPKAIAELQARINSEQAALQNEQTKLQMYQMIAAAEDRLIEQQQREANTKSLARRGYVAPAAVSFDK